MKELNCLFRKMAGKPMTKEQLKFQDILREKVRTNEITVAEGHRIWEVKYGVSGISKLLAERDR